jgi:hypothetical protein
VIAHTVVFRLVHPAGSDAELDFLRTARRELAGIPGVGEFTINRQVSTKSAGDWQFAMVFADQDAYDAYDAHPAHQGFVAGRWVPEVAEFHEYDFTVWSEQV